ncbi:hypothetical protein EON63_15820 [archaeon]|nr:MAG: hypothetical protein EON63_15820 [archaeon]
MAYHIPGQSCPQQENGFDCGVFTIMAADFLSDDLPLEYDQNEMEERRYRIAQYILKGSLPYPIP